MRAPLGRGVVILNLPVTSKGIYLAAQNTNGIPKFFSVGSVIAVQYFGVALIVDGKLYKRIAAEKI
ncbi:MAG: hypothetical protein J5497_04325 [Selenomonadaceae bacterium]|nr:hypothetical protein [Selenomonadaceae bacterium]